PRRRCQCRRTRSRAEEPPQPSRPGPGRPACTAGRRRLTSMDVSRIPLALYVHMPWCVKKCPYCAFNSHGLRGSPDYARYIDCLLADLDGDVADFGPALHDRPVTSVFFGGGTPSLFAPALVGRFLDGARARLPFAPDC